MKATVTALLTIGLFPPLLASPESDYIGKWEIVIANCGDSFRSCALKLEQGKGGLAGELVWRWGSVWKFQGDAVRYGEKGELLLKNDDWASPLALARVGDALEGSVKLKDGATFLVFGVKGEEPGGLSGIWDMKLKASEGDLKGVLKLEEGVGDSFLAEGYNGEGQKVELKDLKRDGNQIGFTIVTANSGTSDPPRRFTGEVRGDVITGKVTLLDGGDKRTVEGARRRRWGPPVKLLKENGFEGWRPRFKTDKFHWTLKDGVLSNSSQGDIDIVSDLNFQDFKLHLEYNVAPGSNSGVYLRGRYEVQIQDDHGKPPESHSNGAVYSRITPSVNPAKPANTWQSYDITLVGRWLTVELNGQKIIDNAHLDGITGGARDPFELAPGPLMLQGDHGKISFRNIILTPALAD